MVTYLDCYKSLLQFLKIVTCSRHVISLASNDSDSARASGLNDCIHQLLPGTGNLGIKQGSFENSRVHQETYCILVLKMNRKHFGFAKIEEKTNVTVKLFEAKCHYRVTK